MQEGMPELVKGERISRAFFAALLEAQKSTCKCKTVRILQRIAKDMTKEFVSED